MAAAPANAKSIWVQQATKFLARYTTPEKIYLACATVGDCSLHQTVISLASQIPPEALLKAGERLKAAGVPILASGDLPGVEGGWFTLRFPGDKTIELWILQPHPNGLAAVYAMDIDQSNPSIKPADIGWMTGFNLFSVSKNVFLKFAPALDSGFPYAEQIFSSPDTEDDVQSQLDQISFSLYQGGPSQ
jgi:hypothetical protein